MHLAELEGQLIASVSLEDHGASSGARKGLRGRLVRKVHNIAGTVSGRPHGMPRGLAEDPLTQLVKGCW